MQLPLFHFTQIFSFISIYNYLKSYILIQISEFIIPFYWTNCWTTNYMSLSPLPLYRQTCAFIGKTH